MLTGTGTKILLNSSLPKLDNEDICLSRICAKQIAICSSRNINVPFSVYRNSDPHLSFVCSPLLATNNLQFPSSLQDSDEHHAYQNGDKNDNDKI